MDYKEKLNKDLEDAIRERESLLEDKEATNEIVKGLELIGKGLMSLSKGMDQDMNRIFNYSLPSNSDKIKRIKDEINTL